MDENKQDINAESKTSRNYQVWLKAMAVRIKAIAEWVWMKVISIWIWTRANTVFADWVKNNPWWATAHILNLLTGILLFFSETIKGNPTLSSFPILTVVIFLCLIFVQIYTEPIASYDDSIESPIKGSTLANSVQAEPVRAKSAIELRREVEIRRSQQRNRWMIFAYSFMLLSLLLTFYPFINPLFLNKEQAQDKDDSNQTDQNREFPSGIHYLKTLRERPISVLMGCSLDSEADGLSCKPKTQPKNENLPSTNEGNGELPPSNKIGNEIAPGTWAINIGGHITKCEPSPSLYGNMFTCEVKGGLLIPLYFIIIALMGGSISLTRRLPELQKQVGSEHVATETQPKLTQYEFREYLIFQMVQFISAPFLAILAYYLIEPSDTKSAVALAFTAGFASETFLLMIRSIANKITPETVPEPQYGAVAGIITFKDMPPEKVEVFLTELPHQGHSITDEQNLYALSNVPVGEHSITVKSIGNGKVLKSDIVKIERAQIIVKKNITIVNLEANKQLNQKQANKEGAEKDKDKDNNAPLPDQKSDL